MYFWVGGLRKVRKHRFFRIWGHVCFYGSQPDWKPAGPNPARLAEASRTGSWPDQKPVGFFFFHKTCYKHVYGVTNLIDSWNLADTWILLKNKLSQALQTPMNEKKKKLQKRIEAISRGPI